MASNPLAAAKAARYFRPRDFACKCGKCSGWPTDPQVASNLQHLIEELDQLRGQVGIPMVVSSGYRCERHPIEAAKSQPGEHGFGTGLDCRPIKRLDTWTNRMRLILAWCNRFGGSGVVTGSAEAWSVGLYPGHIHLGFAHPRVERPAVWLKFPAS